MSLIVVLDLKNLYDLSDTHRYDCVLSSNYIYAVAIIRMCECLLLNKSVFAEQVIKASQARFILPLGKCN